MPLYVFNCNACDYETEELRTLCDYTPPSCAKCKTDMEYIISGTQINIWNGERRFANISNHGDGSMAFGSKGKYEQHLKDNHIAESSLDAPVNRPHGNKVIASVRIY